MPIKEITGDGKAIFVCPDCGSEFSSVYSDPSESIAESIMRHVYETMICPECIAKKDALKKEEEDKQRKAELMRSLDDRMMKTGFPARFVNLEKPWVRSSAEWIYRNRFSSLLASGATGTGKTSSAAFVIRYMMMDSRPRVMYRTWQLLLAEFIKAKTSDGDNECWFLERLDNLDYLIIDELIGKKGEAKLSPSGQDLLFNIIDGAYSQSRKTKVWVLGNFFEGAIDHLIDDPLPTRRRLQDSFKLAWFECGKPVDDTLKIFDESELKRLT